MTEKLSRRDLVLGASAIVGTSLLGGCTKVLGTNTFNNSTEGQVKLNEDMFDLQTLSLFGNNYFVIPMNNAERVLKGGEPSFGLIPEDKARISVRDVGVPGGKVHVDAPKGDLYLPYGYSPTGIVPVSEDLKPVRFITNFEMKDVQKQRKGQGKIDLQRITEEDLPFSDESLRVIGDTGYVVNMGADITNPDMLPIYFTKLPLTAVEYNRAESDGKIRIVGQSYVFGNERSKTFGPYLQHRGFKNPVEEARLKAAAEKADARMKAKRTNAPKQYQSIITDSKRPVGKPKVIIKKLK
jgi:hypothetical protein